MITIADTEQAFDRQAASRVVEQICRKPDSVVGLSTGQTTKGMHRLLTEAYRAGRFDPSRVTFFGVDEVVNVPRSYAGSCYTLLRTELMDALEVPDERFLMLPVEPERFEDGAIAFQAELKRRGGIDLLVLGLGRNGHLGFNQPGTPFNSVTRLARMDEELEARIRRETGIAPQVKLFGATLGLKDIMHARALLLTAKGECKADIVKRMLEGDISPDVPASILQLHPNCEFLLQADATP
ncbi:MAG: glucosamine-6-phosphate deaminase [Mediterranea sp.]|jgi:glucosamine-6-phosphate deaminase|nr:glucosamine-6-phosphate deaminase [Mediterranea sp.]